MRRVYAALSLLLLAPVLVVPSPAQADESGCPDDKWCIDKGTAIVVRDKARGFKLICANGWITPGAPPRIKELCGDPSGVSRIWARSEKARKAQNKADQAQREANICKGEKKACEKRADELEVALEEANTSARRWKVVGYIAGGVALVATGAITGDRLGLWDLTPPMFRAE